MSCVVRSNVPVSFLSNETDFPSLIKRVESIPSLYTPQNYLTIAVVIQQEIEPIIRKEESPVAMQGNVLSAELTQSKGFFNASEKFLSNLLDPVFLTLLDSHETPLTESIAVTRLEERVNKLSKVILLACRIDSDQSALEFFCEGATQELNEMRDSIKGSFKISAQALVSELPCFSHLTNSAEPRLLESLQDLISHSVEKSEESVFTLEPREGVILKKHFDHGESEKTNTKLSFALEDGIIRATQNRNTVKSVFTDLRYESEESFYL